VTLGIRWLSIGPGSGYGDASEAYLSGLRSAGVPVTWTPLGWPSPIWRSRFGPTNEVDLEGAVHRDIVDLPLEHDVVVVCSTPWWHERLRAEAAGRRLVAYTTWETDRLPTEWVGKLNCYDSVVVPSQFNAEVIRSSGVISPLHVVPHIARRPCLAPAPLRRDDKFVFYMIAPWTTRKAIGDAVSAFLRAFSATDDVVLKIHTTPEDHIAGARCDRGERPAADHELTSWFSLANELAGHSRAPEIRLSTNRLTREEIEALHERGDCFVNLSRGEGWGLGAFDAAVWGNPVIVTGWGGSLEFLPVGYPYCVEYDLVPTTTDQPDRWWRPRPGERWARARIDHAAMLMREVVRNSAEARKWGATLRSTVRAGFAEVDVTKRMTRALSE